MSKFVTRLPSLVTAAFCAACLAWPGVASATSAVELTWNPTQYATISGNILTVDVPADAADGTLYGARASFDLDQFEGRTLSASVLARAETLSEPERTTYGIKVIFHFTDPEDSERHYYPEARRPAAPFEWQRMEVVDTVSGGARSPRGQFWLGLQGVSGRVQFDLSTAEVVNGDPLFPSVNGDLTCAYTDRVRNAPQKRGVMLPGRNCTENDFQTLCQWGATLLRYQMTDGPKPASGESQQAYLTRYRTWLGGKLDHLDHDVLPWAVRYGMEVAVDLHTPPGSNDGRMLDDETYAQEFISLWRNIATRFKGRAGIYGYDLCNELNQTGPVLYDYWTIQRLAAEAIRAVDPETPIIIESNTKDSPLTFSYLSPLNLTNVIYELHMYEPGSYTHQGVDGEPFTVIYYPREGRDKTYLQQVLAKARAFEAAHGAKIYVGEFSAPAWAGGVEVYLRDLIDIFGTYGWDWTYHAFREWSGWSVEHEPVSLGITADCFRASVDNPRKRVLLNGLSSPASGTLGHDPQITQLRIEQDDRRFIHVSYHLDETAYVTMDILTNHVSIGGQNVAYVSGDCNQLVPAGDRSILWDARRSWPDQNLHASALSVKLTAWASDEPPPVMDVNLETKAIAYYASFDFLPQGGLTNDIYRTTHLVMKKVEAEGMTFTMGSPEDENQWRNSTETQHLVCLTNDYYLAIYETTRKQFALMGCKVHATYGEQETPYEGDDPDQAPIGRILYNNLRGSVSDGINWPSTESTAGGYLSTMRLATGLPLDLPTEAQWEFACRAGTTTALYTGKGNDAQWGNSDVSPLAWFTGTSGNQVHAVGGKQPNSWGFYDMYGNAREWCLDWYAAYDTSVAPAVDPQGPSSGSERVIRSSYYYDGAKGMRSAFRTSQAPGTANTTYGFRLCVTLP